MSTDYRPLGDLSFSALFDGRLAKHGIREHVNERTAEDVRLLTDGRNFVHVFKGKNDQAKFARFAGNGSYKILNAVCDAFDVRIVSEHDPQYWGYETMEQWANAWEEESQRF